MRIRKVNSVLALLSAVALLVHVGYQCFAYLTMYYNPSLKLVTAIPLMVLVCLHAILGMLILFTKNDGTSMGPYLALNRKTLIQRVSACLFFPLLILHINTFSLMSAGAEQGSVLSIAALVVAEVLFFAASFAHMGTSVTNAFVTLGILASRTAQERLDVTVYVVNGIMFAISLIAIVRAQLFMFM